MAVIIGLFVHFFEAWILVLGWNWYLAAFIGKPLPYWPAFGIVLLVGWLTYHLPLRGSSLREAMDEAKDPDQSESWLRIFLQIFMDAFALLVLWGVHFLVR